jgi:hypothetical protein
MILQKRNLLGNGFAGIMSKIALLEFQAMVHELFVEVLMNQEMHFCRDNIVELKKYLRMKMAYFKEWYDTASQRTEKNSDLTFLSTQTWVNLRFTVCGFIGFAEYVLQTTSFDEIQYIPMLLSNTSNIEFTFSHLRSLGRRDARTYQTRVAGCNVQDSVRAIEKSSSYSASDNLP